MDEPLERSRIHFFQGVEHFEAGRYEAARAAFEAALALAPGRPSILRNLGITLFRLERYDAAVPVLEAADQAEPDQAEVLASLGLAHEAQGRWQTAADVLSRALTVAPQHADLWFRCGMCRARAGALQAALQALDKAIEIAPGFAQAWSARGGLLRELHQLEEAARSFEKAIALGADAELHAFYLAAVKPSAGAPEPPRQYLERLFDDYAADFETHLVGSLRYQGHELLVRPFLESGQRYAHVLDLGCGTGLCGKLIHSAAHRVDGVDVSSAMLARARQTGCYSELIHADIGEFLAGTQLRPDLILAADVSGYVRDLLPIFRSVRKILAPGGCFACTIELPESGADVELRPSLRHAHSETYLRRIAAESGLRIRSLHSAALREDQRDPIMALYVCFE